VQGLKALDFPMDHPALVKAADWLESVQQVDGGWGETCESYAKPELAGRGASIPSQTAWALLALFAVGTTSGPTVEAGIEYLLRTQQPEGGWEDTFWNGTGFPRVFFLKYHLYAAYFPLWALGVYHRAMHA
jgi:squalene-hopene/tetraprenyl-beta-curcumene cyclase